MINHVQFQKLREREAPTFANLNLLGPCNVDCYFCLGKDINEVWKQQNQTKVHYSEWENLTEFLQKCKDAGIPNIYVTGQNTDALIYKHLDELLQYLQDDWGFDAGIRTNGYLAHRKLDVVNQCRRSVGYSIHTLDTETNWTIMRRRDIPDWEQLLTVTEQSRVSIVLNRHNEHQLPGLLEYIGQFPNVKYIQVRKICTDTRDSWLLPDAEAYERVAAEYAAKHEETRKFYGAPCYNIHGKEVVFWRTVKTSIGSFNYYTDGSYTDDYFVIEGYQNSGVNYPRENGIPVQVESLEGYWREQKRSKA